jgi:hypothetical protein
MTGKEKNPTVEMTRIDGIGSAAGGWPNEIWLG